MVIQILDGLVYGGFLYILSVGLVLIFGLRRVVNFAHGGLFMLGAYVAYAAASVAGFWIGLVVAAVVVLAAFGASLDTLAFRRLQGQDPIVTMLVTFGLLMILEDAVRTVWGKDFLSVAPPALLSSAISLPGGSFPTYRIAVIVVAITVMAALSLWLRFSRIGLYVRAASTDSDTTGMQGVDTERLGAVVVGLGAGLAGLAGAIASPLLALSPSMGGLIVIDCFIVVITGGLGSFAGAFIAAMVIGEVDNFGVIYFPEFASIIL